MNGKAAPAGRHGDATAGGAAATRGDATRPRGRDARRADGRARGADVAAPPDDADARRSTRRRRDVADAPDADAPPTRDSLLALGGALLIGAALAIVAVVLVFVFTRGGDEPGPVRRTPDDGDRDGVHHGRRPRTRSCCAGRPGRRPSA